MALSYTRFLCRRNVGANNFMAFYSSNASASSTVVKKIIAADESHDKKNKRLKRPMSPHMTIYQVQVTSLLSITHRATGIILSGYATTIGLNTIFMPGGMPCFIEAVHALCLPAAVIFVAKIALALPATFHFFNGIRHLAWDLGLFLNIKAVYTTGYATVLLAAATSVMLAIL